MSPRLISLSLLLSSCALSQGITSPGSAPSTRVREATIPIESEGVRFVGMGHYPRQTSRHITFTLPKGAQYALLSTCGRKEKWVNPPEQFKLHFIPNRAEDSRWGRSDSCPLELLAIDSQGREHWAVVDIGDDSSLEARVDCDTHPPYRAKFSTCQTGVGILMVVSFDKPVRPYSSALLPSCPAPQPGHKLNIDQGRVWEVSVGRDLCVYGFVDATYARHRLTTRGWDDVGIYR